MKELQESVPASEEVLAHARNDFSNFVESRIDGLRNGEVNGSDWAEQRYLISSSDLSAVDCVEFYVGAGFDAQDSDEPSYSVMFLGYDPKGEDLKSLFQIEVTNNTVVYRLAANRERMTDDTGVLLFDTMSLLKSLEKQGKLRAWE